MNFQTKLIPATLIRRYKRFLADVELADGSVAVAHCPNPGAMTGLADPGMTVWLEPNDDPKKKLKYGWRLVELPGGHWAGVDTGAANRIAGEALAAGAIAELAAYETIRPEVKYGAGSRVDFLLTGGGAPDAYVEVKSVTLRRTGTWAEFPDSVTKRGAKHLDELAKMVAAGHRAVMFYIIQRDDCDKLRLAADIDPGYAAAFDAARAAGVEVVAYGARISGDAVTIGDAASFSEAHVTA